MITRTVATALACIALLTFLPVPRVRAQTGNELLRSFRAQPNDLARRQYLLGRLPDLSPANRDFARQLLATVDDDLGLYDLALRDFPFDNRIPLRRPLPWVKRSSSNEIYGIVTYVHGAGDVIAVNAADAVARLAVKRRIVLVNEAHDDPHTRVLILALLPKLRAQGYDYFAAEALVEDGTALAQRGYPLNSSGTEYLREPLYGDILREAIRLGYKIVAYDPVAEVADRDQTQAETLYRKVFAHDPQAHLFVLAGYAHIGKARGYLGDIQPMAMRLHELTGFDPLSVDQTQFREVEPSPHIGPYHQIIDVLNLPEPFVLQSPQGNRIWSSDPARHDVSVVLPPMQGRQRPDWLALGGQRQPWPISAAMCHGVLPCVVGAHYGSEPDDAIPADRYTFLAAPATSVLYLRPGSYRWRAWGSGGKVVDSGSIQIRGH